MTDRPPGAKPARSLGSRTARGVVWMMFLKFAMQGLGLISTLILVRLLSPEDFGLVAMAMVLIAIMEIFVWFSFDVVLIQKQDAVRADYDTAWTYTVLFYTASALLLIALAYPASLYYDEPRVKVMVMILALGVFLTGFENIGVVNFRKNLQFDKEFKLRVSKKIAAFCVTVPLAFWLRNYWALIAGMMTGRIVGLLLSYAMEPYRPRFCLSSRAELFHFSKWLFFSNLFYALRMRGAELIVGRISGARTLALFTVSYEISNLPTTALMAPINRAVFPGYAQLSADMSAMRAGYLKVISIISLLLVPAGLGIAASSPILVPVVLGDKWLETTALVSILGFYGVVSGLQTNIGSVYLALGRPQVLMWLHFLHLVALVVIAIPATLHFSIIGTAWSYLGVSLLLLPINYAVMFKTISLRPLEFFKCMWRPLMAGAVMYFGVARLAQHMHASTGGQPGITQFGTLVLAGMMLYGLTAAVLWVWSGRPAGAESYLIDVIRSRLAKRAAT